MDASVGPRVDLFVLVLELLLSVALMVAVASAVIVGPARLRRAASGAQWRLDRVLPYLIVIGVALLLRLGTGGLRRLISWRFGWNITWRLSTIEGPFVASIQAYQTGVLDQVFVFAYLHGYVFLLVFPVVAYFSLDTLDRLSELLVAFTINFVVGMVLYTAFVAYGPWSIYPDRIDDVLSAHDPAVSTLVTTINQNVDVFPSLHASLSVTVLLFAWRTRETYPEWVPIAAVLATTIVVSTMYLGLHWATDVVAGTLLAGGSYIAAIRFVGSRTGGDPTYRQDRTE